MLVDLIIISNKLTINASVTYLEYIQYPVNNTYNNEKDHVKVEIGVGGDPFFIFPLA